MNIRLNQVIAVIVALYGILLFVFSVANLPAGALYFLPLSVVPIFLFFKCANVGSSPFYDMESILMIIGATSLFYLSFAFRPYLDPIDNFKFLLVFVFYFMGRNSDKETSIEAFSAPLLVLLGVAGLTLLYYFFVLDGSGFYRGDILFLPNRNVLSGFVIALCFAISVISPSMRWVALVGFMLIVIGTLGGLVALALALVLGYRDRSKPLLAVMLIILSGVLVYFMLAPGSGVLARLVNAYTLVSAVLAKNSLMDVMEMSFADAFHLVGSDDTSIFFRIKIWLDIGLIALSNPWHLIFGFGFSAAETLTVAQKIPHNDWLRVFFEAGIFGFMLFSWVVCRGLLACRRHSRGTLILGLTFAIFMLSENLIDNFFISFLCFYFFGIIQQKTAEVPLPSRIRI